MAAANARTPIVRREGVAPADDYEGDGLDAKSMQQLITACSYGWFMWNLMYTMIVPMLPIYKKDYNLSTMDCALILASIQAGFIVGVMVYKGGLRPDMAIKIGGVCYVIGPALIAFDPGLTMLCIGRLVEGFGAAPLIITHDATMARKLAPHQKGRAYGIKGMVGTSGLFFGPIVGSTLYQMGGLRMPMIVIAVMGVLGLGLYWGYLPEDIHAERNKILDEGKTYAERSAHFTENNLMTCMMFIQFLTFVIIGIFFLAVPDYLMNFWQLDMGMMVMLWLGWDVLKMIFSGAGGGFADTNNLWLVCFGGLITQSFLIFVTAESASAGLLGKAEWKFHWFLWAAGFTLAMGTTIDGFIGGPFVKLLTEIERLIGNECYEELFTVSVTVVALGEMAGNIYAGFVYDSLGFGLCLWGFAWCHMICMLICGYSLQGMVRPLFDTDKHSLDDPNSI